MNRPPGLQALLLAAGRGERLRPLTDLVPKPAIALPGAPLGAWMLESLLARFESVAVNCSHLAPVVISQLALEGRVTTLREEPEPFGTGGTLAAIRDRVEDRIVVVNADVLSDIDLDAVLDAHGKAGTPATVAVRRVTSGADFALGRGGRIGGFVDRRSRGGVTGLRFIGVSIYERAALDRLPDERPLGLGETLLARLASEGELAAYVHDGYVADVGTLQSYMDACRDVLSGATPPPPPGPYRGFAGDLIEVDGGRAFLASSASGDDAHLGPGAVILAGARLQQGTTVDHAIVWINEQVPSGAEVRDCIRFRGQSLTFN